jgi:hypothetical protein
VDVNHTRYRPADTAGHYESFFQRANHPERPLAFWIRYTIFSPRGRPADALGELWAIYFDGERNEHVAVKSEVPLAACAFDRTAFSARIGEARLEPGRLIGEAASNGHRIAWDLGFEGDAPPLLLLPPAAYTARLPRAKALVGLPMAAYRGRITIDGRAVDVADWVGSQNHNWGSQHTDHYAWGQVAGFDTHPASFLEVTTARLRLGPFWTPFFTMMVLRHEGTEFALNRPAHVLRARGTFGYFDWHFSSRSDAIRIDGTITAPRSAFVGLTYYNPPGGTKQCLNSKIAACTLRVTRNGAAEVLSTRHRAAFEILTDDHAHGIEIRI